jgi:hypothetical protein
LEDGHEHTHDGDRNTDCMLSFLRSCFFACHRSKPLGISNMRRGDRPAPEKEPAGRIPYFPIFIPFSL